MMGLLADTESKGAALPDPHLLGLLSADNALHPCMAGFPIVLMSSSKVKDALMLSRKTPPEVKLVEGSLYSLLAPFDRQTSICLQSIQSVTDKAAFAKERKDLRNNFKLKVNTWARKARASCLSTTRSWNSSDLLLGAVRGSNGAQLQFPVEAVISLTGTVQNIDIPTQETTAEASTFQLADDLHDDQVSKMGSESLVDHGLSSSLSIALNSTLDVFNAFVVDLQSYYKGSFGEVQRQKRSRGRVFGAMPHPLYSDLEKVVHNDSSNILLLNGLEFFVFYKSLWQLAEETAANDLKRLYKPHLVFRERRANHDDLVEAETAQDSFCSVILHILQHPQWSITASSAMLLNSLSQDPEERKQQLVLAHRCLHAWITVTFLRSGTILCLPVMKSARAKRGIFQNVLEFWEFSF